MQLTSQHSLKIFKVILFRDKVVLLVLGHVLVSSAI